MEDFKTQVKTLQDEKKWSQQRLIREASSYDAPGTSPDTIRDAVTNRRGFMPSAVAIEAIANALGVSSHTFAIYKLVQARELLDPARVGAVTALAAADVLLAHRDELELTSSDADAADEIDEIVSAPADAPSGRQRA